MEQKNNSAKFAFFYMLSLVALLFMSLSAGMIIFQIINKYIIDIIDQYRGRFSSGQLKFAISAVLVSSPIYYFTARQIYKNLFAGELSKDSGIRKWLTYFTLLVATVTMIGWMIAVVNNLLEGELTTKIILKAITAIFISASIFTFYLYDIKREEVAGKKDIVIKIYFYVTLVLIIAVFVASLFIVESPRETRKRKLDNNIITNFESIHSAINDYYNNKDILPENLEIILEDSNYINERVLKNPESGKMFEYRIVDKKTFELCAEFKRSNKNDEDMDYDYFKQNWPHEAGWQCIKQKVEIYEKGPIFERDIID